MRYKTDKISVFDYKDYRDFLKDWYNKAKEEKRAVSYRSFSKRAGFHSTNYFMLIMQGKRNLSEDGLKKMMVGLKLNKQEQEFFRNLVFFNQAKTLDDRNFYYEKLLQSRKYKQLKPIEKKSYEYYSKWYHPVVRELVVSKEFDGTPEWIAEHIFPSITPAQAEKSIALLKGLGFIKKNGDSKWKQTSAIISTGPDVASLVVHNYHKIILDLSKHILDNVPLEDRDVSTLTLGIKEGRLDEIKTLVREFRKEILKLVSEDAAEEVAQLNIQLFPVSKRKKKQDMLSYLGGLQ